MHIRPWNALAVFFALLIFAPGAAAERITFVLTNDIYQMSEQRGPDGKLRGGFARLAAVVKAERARGNPVIVTHGGDTLSPSLMSGLDRGAHIITLTNLIRPDVFAPGNHEFDFGKDVFLQRMSEATFPRYAANLRNANGQPLAGFKDSEILALGNVRVGVIGAAFDDSARLSNPGDLKFQPTVATVKAKAEQLRRDGADMVVVVTHATRQQAIEIADSNDVDMTLTGHTHDLYISFDGRALITESSHDAHYVVVIDVDVEIKTENGRRKITWWPNFRVIDTANVTPDLEVLSVVAGFEAELTREMDVALAKTNVEIDSRNATVRSREAIIGNIIADAMRAQTDADVAVANGGGIRSGNVYTAGSEITRKDILAELPFDNRLVRLNLTGAELRAALENGFSGLPAPAGRFPQVSGLQIDVDASRPVGSRIVSIKADGKPLDDAKTYSVATNDYLARGGDGYTQFKDAPRLIPDDDAPLLANAVMVYVRRLGTINAMAMDRIVKK
jgi:2',3'-cyclic-nucleotide 2'-phosphodiesterase (5'-nucleotidase family)